MKSSMELQYIKTRVGFGRAKTGSTQKVRVPNVISPRMTLLITFYTTQLNKEGIVCVV